MRKCSKRLLAVVLSLIMVMTVVMPAMAEGGNAFQVGDATFATLAEAISAAGDNGTVTLLANAEGSGVVIDSNVTIDFDSHTYTFTEPAVGSTGTQSNGFQILQGNNVTLKNGTLNVSSDHAEKYYILVQNYANLTVSNMALDGTNLDKWSTTDGDSYVLSNNCGNVKIDQSTITANDDGALAYAFDAFLKSGYTAPTVTATNCLVIGMVEVTGGELVVNGGVYKPTAQCTDAFIVSSGSLTLNGDVSVTGGELNQSTAIWALETGKVTINDGTYTFNMPVSDSVVDGYNDLIYAKGNASITINGGRFSGPARNSDGTHFLLNKKDADNATATITVKGGIFEKFNPADTNTEPATASDNFVADGYCVLEGITDSGKLYTVGKHELVHKDATAPTCTESGIKEHWYCESCQKYYASADATESTPIGELSIDPTWEHSFTKTEAKEATCGKDGNKAYWYCSSCDLYYLSDTDDFSGFSESLLKANTSIAKTNNHTMEEVPGYAPTCGSSGRDTYWYCSSCELCYLTEDGAYTGYTKDEINDEIIAPPPPDLDHNLVEVPAVEATCGTDGHKAYWQCSVCEWWSTAASGQPVHNKSLFENYYATNLLIPATGEHKMTEVPGVDATCGKDGTSTYWYCSECDLCYFTEDGSSTGYTEDDAKEQAIIIQNGKHSFVEVPAVEVTCTKDGHDTYWQCSVCGKCSSAESGQPVYSEETFKKLGEAAGYFTPATGEHKMTEVPGYEPTCGSSGRDTYWYCSECELCYLTEDGAYAGYTKDEINDEIIAPPPPDLKHNLVEVPEVPATCTKDGCKAYWQCSVCGACSTAASGQPVHNKTTFDKYLAPNLVIPAIGEHKLTKVEAVAPTYTAEGNVEHYTCSACDELFADAEGKTATTKEAVTLPRLIEIKEEAAEITSGAVDTAIEKAETSDVVIDLVEVAEDDTPATETAPEIVAATLPVASLDKVAEISEEATLTVNMTEVTVTMDSKTMAAVSEQSKGDVVTLKVEKVETKTLTKEQQSAVEDKEVAIVLTATLISNNTAISDFKGGVVTISVPFTVPAGAKAEDFKVYYLDDEGNLTAHDTKYENGCLIFTTTHFSDYVVVNTAASADAPNTGAGESVAIYAVALTFSMICAVALVIGKKKFSC